MPNTSKATDAHDFSEIELKAIEKFLSELRVKIFQRVGELEKECATIMREPGSSVDDRGSNIELCEQNQRDIIRHNHNIDKIDQALRDVRTKAFTGPCVECNENYVPHKRVLEQFKTTCCECDTAAEKRLTVSRTCI